MLFCSKNGFFWRKGEKMNKLNSLLNNETIEIERKRKIILNGLIFYENENEKQREENILKFEELLNNEKNIKNKM